MKTHRFPRTCIETLEARIAPALLTTLTWQGDVGTNGWNDGTVNTNTNWLSNLSAHKIPVDTNLLVFPAGAAQKTNINDIAGLDLRSISFTGDGYNISGNAITLSNGLTANYATTGSNSFAIPITLKADQTFAFSGNTTANFNLGQIDLGGKTLTIDNTFNVFANNVLTGAGALIKNGPGTLLLGAGHDFSGPVLANAGVLLVFTAGPTGNALGAAGGGNGTTVASGAALVFATAFVGNVAEDLTISGAGTAAEPGAIVIRDQGGSAPDAKLLGALRLGSDATITGDANHTQDSLTFAGAVGAADDALAILTVNSAVMDSFAFANTATFTTELAGLTPGAGGHDQLKVIGPVDLGGAALNVVPSFTPQLGAKFVIVDNDGTDAITGTFAGLAEGATVSAGGVNFTISYKGLDGVNGNDVVLTVTGFSDTPGTVALSNGGKTATFTDVDGDIVTVKTTKGPFQQDDFRLAVAGNGAQLQQLNLTARPGDFIGANITITAKLGPDGGNGFVNVGYLNATGIDLGVVKIAGDLGRIAAGTVGGDVKIPGLKSLTVESIGLLGTSTQAMGGTLKSSIEGALPKLTMKGDLRGDFFVNGDDGRLGKAVIGGSYTTDLPNSGGVKFSAEAGFGSIKIGSDIRTANSISAVIESPHGAIGSLIVGGSIVGTNSFQSVFITTFGQSVAPASGTDFALKTLKVGGSVEFTRFDLGEDLTLGKNADASIGSIIVAGDWIGSSIRAGTTAGNDPFAGNDDDAKFSGGNTRDNPAIFSSVGSFVVKGQALGTGGDNSDMYGIVAERIGKAKIGKRTFAFTNGATPEIFFAAPTGPGKGTENPDFDFTIRELDSSTPAASLGGVNLDVSSDGKTATFTDVDGDKVTVKRTVGAFVAADFDITTLFSGGGQLNKLTITAAPGNLTFTATPGPLGGNGFVNVGEIVATGIAVGKVTIAGDLARFAGGPVAAGQAGTAALTAHSLGALGTSTGASSLTSDFENGLGKLTVATDVRSVNLDCNGASSLLGVVTIGGAFVRDSSPCRISANDGIASVKIGGSVRGGQLSASLGPIGPIVIGGDLIGPGGVNSSISAFGQEVSPATGLDLAIKSLTVKGNIEKARLTVSANANADAAIGAVRVGRAWLASSLLVGTDTGTDGLPGTSDDKKVFNSIILRDEARFSTIASITIKGQAFGSITAGDSFGIVAEQILKAKIGKRTFTFDQGERDATDAFALGVTGPGPAPDNALSDFFIREITV